MTEQLLATDPNNPQVAARLASAFNLWKRYEPGRRAQMRGALKQITDVPNLSRDVGEIVERALADA